ncbi:alpha/beta hydrolase [Demequina salsinemoris]|uniref:alpha/beta hydrolase n=1 Tax=Demequina salsinemoris TaxID=577470 RepID=UPI000781BCA0|nr:alpha/beta hydrolase-fold protein [Demequina salsinemoris]
MTSLLSVTSSSWPSIDDAVEGPLLLMLHGYGSNEHDLAGLAPMLPRTMPWASVRAPLEMGFDGAAWFPLQAPTLAYRPDAVAKATEDLWAWIDKNVPASAPILPLGFSQGGLMALQLLRTRPERLAGAIVLSGFVADVPGPADERLAALRPPVLWARGDADMVIPPAEVARMERWLPTHAAATIRLHDRLGHGIDERVMGDVIAFIDSLEG